MPLIPRASGARSLLFRLVLTLVLALPLAACSVGTPPPATAQAPPPATAAPPPATQAPPPATPEPPPAAPKPPPTTPEPPAATTPVERVPILMYHEIGDVDSSLYVRPAEFAQHVAVLAAEGYTPVSLLAVHRHFFHDAPLPPSPVVLTFDDGYASTYELAFPLLQAHGFTATVFVITDFVGLPGYLSWAQVAELAAAGWEIGNHTATHPDLARLGPAALHQQIDGAAAALQQHLGQTAPVFSYPAGSHSAAVQDQLRAAGYTVAVTTRPGAATRADNPLLWPRVRISRGDNGAVLSARLRAESDLPQMQE